MSQATPEEVNRAVALDLKARGITQKEAGETIGKSRAVISNQLSSKRRFSKAMAVLFCRAFGYSVNYLLYGQGEMMDSEVIENGRILKSVVSVPAPDGPSDEVTIFACLLDVAEGILRVIGETDAIQAFHCVEQGDFAGYVKNMKNLSAKYPSYSYPPILAKCACDRIKSQMAVIIEEHHERPSTD